MITTVTLNPAIDKVLEISQLQLGNVHRVEKETVSFGGKSINVARILTGLGVKTKAVCFLGDKNYEEIKELSNKDGLDIEAIFLNGMTRTNVKIVEPDHDYRTTDINEVGFRVDKEKLDLMIKLIEENALKSEYIVFSGSLPKGVSVDFYKSMAIRLKPYTKVIIDADGDVLKASLEGQPFMIKPNIHELESITDVELKTKEDIVSVSKFLIDKYKINYILVSRGDKGSILVGKDIVLNAGILAVNVLSTVGAGDSMLAGMIYGLLEDTNKKNIDYLIKSLSYGVATSSIAISSQDHKVIQATDLLAMASKVDIEENN